MQSHILRKHTSEADLMLGAEEGIHAKIQWEVQLKQLFDLLDKSVGWSVDVETTRVRGKWKSLKLQGDTAIEPL